MPEQLQDEGVPHEAEVDKPSTCQKRSIDDSMVDEGSHIQQGGLESSDQGSPAYKKQRLEEPDGGALEHVTEASTAAPASHMPKPLGSTETKDQDLDTAAKDLEECSEEIAQASSQEDDEDSATNTPLDWNSGTHKAVRTSFGAAVTSFKPTQRSLDVDTGGVATPKGLEDSVDGTDQVQAGPARESISGREDAGSANEAAVEKEKQSSSTKQASGSVLRRKGVDWILPDLNPEASGSRKDEFLAWCRNFCSSNASNLDKADARIIRRGYLVRLDGQTMPEWLRKECKKGARNTESSQVEKILSGFSAEEPSQLSEGEIVSGPEDTGEAEPSEASGGKVQLSRDEELQQLRHYYPGASETDFCVLCAKDGHRANDCPPPKCKHCQSQGHGSAQCSTRVRCGRCRRLGHSKKSCPEKLAVAPGEEEMECAVCGATDHLEDFCESLWRTYYPNPENIVKVKSIAAFCYYCGVENHYGGDCSLNLLERTCKDETWTVANRDRYIDPECDTLQISWVPPPPPDDFEGPNFGGRSIVPQKNHIYFESDEEEEGEFIQPPVRSRAQAPSRQQIRINSQTSSRGQGNMGGGRVGDSIAQRRANGAGNRNPPLPPGPPPSLPARPPTTGVLGAGSMRGGPSGRRGRGGFSRVRGGGQR